MKDTIDIKGGCGCSKDTVEAVTDQGVGCCSEASVENSDSACCTPECCASEQDVIQLGEPRAGAKGLDIEFMYLDLSVCDRCQGTEGSLEEALSEVARVLELAGVEVTLQKIHVQSEEQARRLGFISSPTIRVNGIDIQQVRGAAMDVKESACQCGGALCGQDVDCRDWVYRGKEYTTPPKGLIVEAILREVYGGEKEASDVPARLEDIPDNLKRFFAARRRQVAEAN